MLQVTPGAPFSYGDMQHSAFQVLQVGPNVLQNVPDLQHSRDRGSLAEIVLLQIRGSGEPALLPLLQITPDLMQINSDVLQISPDLQQILAGVLHINVCAGPRKVCEQAARGDLQQNEGSWRLRKDELLQVRPGGTPGIAGLLQVRESVRKPA